MKRKTWKPPESQSYVDINTSLPFYQSPKSPDVEEEPVIQKNSKHSPVVIKAVRKYEEDDLEHILNYEDSQEIKQYEQELKIKYEEAYVDGETAGGVIAGDSMKKSDSYGSLMNILRTMKKSNLSKSVSVSRLNFMQNTTERDKQIVRDTHAQDSHGGGHGRRKEEPSESKLLNNGSHMVRLIYTIPTSTQYSVLLKKFFIGRVIFCSRLYCKLI